MVFCEPKLSYKGLIMKKVSIVIGLYNSEKTIEAVLDEIKTTFESQSKYDYEVVLVDDYSPDGVFELVKGIAEGNERIKVIHLAKNAGQTTAVLEGYHYVTGDYVVNMDDDFQMPAYEVPRMIEKLEKDNLDVVFAKYPEQKEGFARRMASKLNNWSSKISVGKPKEIRVNSFIAMRRFVMEGMLKYRNNYPYWYGIIFAITKNVANLEVDHRERTNGKSNYSFRTLFSLWLNGFLNFSIQPLRVASRLGALVTIVSFILAIVLILQRFIIGTALKGWTSLMVAIIFFAGVQLICIGMLGEYLGRLFITKSGIPRATVRDTVNVDDEED